PLAPTTMAIGLIPPTPTTRARIGRELSQTTGAHPLTRRRRRAAGDRRPVPGARVARVPRRPVGPGEARPGAAGLGAQVCDTSGAGRGLAGAVRKEESSFMVADHREPVSGVRSALLGRDQNSSSSSTIRLTNPAFAPLRRSVRRKGSFLKPARIQSGLYGVGSSSRNLKSCSAFDPGLGRQFGSSGRFSHSLVQTAISDLLPQF